MAEEDPYENITTVTKTFYGYALGKHVRQSSGLVKIKRTARLCRLFGFLFQKLCFFKTSHFYFYRVLKKQNNILKTKVNARQTDTHGSHSAREGLPRDDRIFCCKNNILKHIYFIVLSRTYEGFPSHKIILNISVDLNMTRRDERIKKFSHRSTQFAMSPGDN